MRLDDPLNDVFQGSSHVRVLRALYHLPMGFAASAREIARRSGLSHPTASKVLSSLAEQGLVTRSRAPRAAAFELRRTHTAAEPLAALFDWESDLQKEVLSFLREEISRHAPSLVIAAYLYGSAVTGDMRSASDIDVAVLHAEGEGECVAAVMEEIGEKVRERFGNPLSVLLTDASVEELQRSRRTRSRLWREILREGLPILDPQTGSPDG